MVNITQFVGIMWGWPAPAKKKGWDGKNTKRPLKLEGHADLGPWIKRAIANTEKKFGIKPEVIYVSDTWATRAPKFVDGIRVIPKKTVQVSVIWVGWEVPIAEAREFERNLHRGDFKK